LKAVTPELPYFDPPSFDQASDVPGLMSELPPKKRPKTASGPVRMSAGLHLQTNPYSTTSLTLERPTTAPATAVTFAASSLAQISKGKKRVMVSEIDPDADTEEEYDSEIDGMGLDSCPLTSQE
jgi:hypothetical protein